MNAFSIAGYRLLIPMNLLTVAWVGYSKILFGFLGFDTVGWYAFALATAGTVVLLTCLGTTTWCALQRRRRGLHLTPWQAAAQGTVWASMLAFGAAFPDSTSESDLPSVAAALAGKTTTNDPATAHQRYHHSAIDTLGDNIAMSAFLIGAAAWVCLLISLSRRKNP